MATKGLTANGIAKIVPSLKQTLLNAHGEGEALDVLGDIKSIESQLATIRKGAAVEFEDGMAGKRWRFEQGRRSIRSYNTPRLVKAFADALGEPLWQTFVWLYRKDVIRLSWQQTNLERAAAETGIPLTEAQHEITDGDDADVGVNWKSAYPSYKRVDG